MCCGEIQGLGAYNEIAQGVFQLAVDRFAMLNKGIDAGSLAFSTGRAMRHIRGEDLDNLVEDACYEITKPVTALLAGPGFKKPFLFWLFPNYHMVVAINTQDLR